MPSHVYDDVSNLAVSSVQIPNSPARIGKRRKPAMVALTPSDPSDSGRQLRVEVEFGDGLVVLEDVRAMVGNCVPFRWQIGRGNRSDCAQCRGYGLVTKLLPVDGGRRWKLTIVASSFHHDEA